MAGLLMVAAGAVQAVTAGAASAATIPFGAVKVVSQPSGFHTTAGQTVRAVCPSDHPRVLGGGFTTTGTHIVVSELKPVGSGAVVNGVPVDGYEVTAGFDDIGTSASWQVLAYAYCSTTAPGWEVRVDSRGPAVSVFQEAFPACSSGKQLVGTGGQITGGAGQVELVTQPGGVARSAAGGVVGPNGFGGTWSVTGYAICVNVSSVLDVGPTQPFQTPADTSNPKSITATCPPETQLTGSSMWTDSPAHAISLRPNGATPTSVTAISRDDNQLGTRSTMTAWAICAK